MAYNYENRPKNYTDDYLCMCSAKERFPTAGDIDVPTGKGYTIRRTMYWCKNCGLSLPLHARDEFGLTWEQIQAKQVKAAQEKIRSKVPKDIEDPLA